MSTNAVELVVFIGMGASCILVYDALLVSLPYEALLLLAGGCAVYVVGIIFFILGEFKPIYHVIWHLFVLLAALMHWFCIYFFVVNTRLDILPTILSSFENRRFPIMDN